MREILFRAWDKDLKKMFYSNKCHFNVGKGGVCMCHKEWIDELLAGGFVSQGYHTTKLLMQYTGLDDKNGKKIYGGDILLVTNPDCQLQKMKVRGRVDFRYCAWYVVDLKSLVWQKYNVPPPVVNDSMLFATIIDSKGIEVIGNIHDNPELLETL